MNHAATLQAYDGSTTVLPFDDTITIQVTAPQPVEFPLYLRIPAWCQQATISINGRQQSAESKPSSYFKIQRVWHQGDVLTVQLPMSVAVNTSQKNKDSVSIQRGPLTYSLKVDEHYRQDGGTDAWPAWEIKPKSAWNFGLVLDSRKPAALFPVSKTGWPQDDQPFRAESAPIELKAWARQIPDWTADRSGAIGPLPASPVRVSTALQEITLIPMGCARLRISAFPTVTTKQ